MSETKPGGAEEQKPESELPPDLEQEKREIEARIEQHVAKLQEIAGVFGIDTSEFSDEDDTKRGERYKELVDSFALAGEDDLSVIISFEGDRRVSTPARFILSGDRPLGTAGKNATEALAEGQKHDLRFSQHQINYLVEIETMGKRILTSNEDTAYNYFRGYDFQGIRPDHPRGYYELVRDIPSMLSYLELRKVIGNQKDIKPEDREFIEEIKDPYSQRKSEPNPEIREKYIKAIDCYMDNDQYVKALVMANRVTCRIYDIVSQRLWYLNQLAEQGDQRFQEESKSKGRVVVSQNSQFTEEDARKAAEMNLPWSRIEKETEQESTKE